MRVGCCADYYGGQTPTLGGAEPAVTTDPCGKHALGGWAGWKQKLRPMTVKNAVTASRAHWGSSMPRRFRSRSSSDMSVPIVPIRRDLA